ncbi:hypothetical protein HK102_002233 [Quaeritorhiza haematococci]|nr:hypothetical protein HK102_002233 [Quaeritorhiza haematococci]
MFPTTPDETVAELVEHISEEFDVRVRAVELGVKDEATGTTDGSKAREGLNGNGKKDVFSEVRIVDWIKSERVLWLEVGRQGGGSNSVAPGTTTVATTTGAGTRCGTGDLRYIGLSVNRTSVRQSFHEVATRLGQVRLEVNVQQQLKREVDGKVELRLNIIKWVGLVYLTLQLLVIIYLTDELGWDFMEPVSYLVTLGTVLLMFAYSVFRKQDYTYPNGELWLRNYFAKRISRRLKFDDTEYQMLLRKEKDVEGRAARWALLLKEREIAEIGSLNNPASQSAQTIQPLVD